ncbi:hypothetical protein WJX73_006980 [Symbiochloris irregularis]|uniref:Uncharacterized protein n=1 Tax=Symbiochloris irregularis TaxID=706552 RepID=A0AAW1P9H3_9CHLO
MQHRTLAPNHCGLISLLRGFRAYAAGNGTQISDPDTSQSPLWKVELRIQHGDDVDKLQQEFAIPRDCILQATKGREELVPGTARYLATAAAAAGVLTLLGYVAYAAVRSSIAGRLDLKSLSWRLKSVVPSNYRVGWIPVADEGVPTVFLPLNLGPNVENPLCWSVFEDAKDLEMARSGLVTFDALTAEDAKLQIEWSSPEELLQLAEQVGATVAMYPKGSLMKITPNSNAEQLQNLLAEARLDAVDLGDFERAAQGIRVRKMQEEPNMDAIRDRLRASESSVSYDELRAAVSRVTQSTEARSSQDSALTEVFPEGYEAPSAAEMEAMGDDQWWARTPIFWMISMQRPPDQLSALTINVTVDEGARVPCLVAFADKQDADRVVKLATITRMVEDWIPGIEPMRWSDLVQAAKYIGAEIAAFPKDGIPLRPGLSANDLADRLAAFACVLPAVPDPAKVLQEA